MLPQQLKCMMRCRTGDPSEGFDRRSSLRISLSNSPEILRLVRLCEETQAAESSSSSLFIWQENEGQLLWSEPYTHTHTHTHTYTFQHRIFWLCHLNVQSSNHCPHSALPEFSLGEDCLPFISLHLGKSSPPFSLLFFLSFDTFHLETGRRSSSILSLFEKHLFSLSASRFFSSRVSSLFSTFTPLILLSLRPLPSLWSPLLWLHHALLSMLMMYSLPASCRLTDTMNPPLWGWAGMTEGPHLLKSFILWLDLIPHIALKMTLKEMEVISWIVVVEFFIVSLISVNRRKNFAEFSHPD